ncbi:MAG: TonB family protein [Elusimicrobia bacterium]|nr:TonB family protein [Elusimicrobiota bacterium]
MTVEVILLPRPRLVQAVSAEGPSLVSETKPEILGERREYRLPPASPGARATELDRALNELRRLLGRATPDSDVSLKMSLSLSAPAPAAMAQDGSLADYLARVRARIESQKAYPSIARQLRFEGRVLLRTLIRADGTVGDASVLASAGEHLDRAALAAVRRAAPFPSPTELGLDSVTVEVPIAYVLR